VARARFAEILRQLAEGEVEFVVVGRVGYEQLVDRSIELKLAGGRAIRVLTLPALIETKERAGRPKDLAALPSCARLPTSKHVGPDRPQASVVLFVDPSQT
jgi:hypothetical protein